MNPATTKAEAAAGWQVPEKLELEIEELISHYPQKRSAVLMILHALQDHFGFISREAMEWTARKLELQPIHVLELVTFYPMFQTAPRGRFHLKICRTLSCALSGSYALRDYLCDKLGLDREAHGPQTTSDGRFTVEFVECLASCGSGPVLMINDQFHERVDFAQADTLLSGCQ